VAGNRNREGPHGGGALKIKWNYKIITNEKTVE